ncbi:Malonyl CoA-acyl carrier protein transacylase [compost metagenome]
MRSAAERLEETLAGIQYADASVPVVVNVTAQPVHKGEEVPALLTQQVYSPVLWEDIVRWLIEQGVDTFVEIGPGSVLTGLLKKIDKNVRGLNINSLESLEQVAATLKDEI